MTIIILDSVVVASVVQLETNQLMWLLFLLGDMAPAMVMEYLPNGDLKEFLSVSVCTSIIATYKVF